MKIALFGKMRSGKDTVGKILIDDYNCRRFAFGDGIGAIIERFFPDELKKGKPRKHYQHIGQELRKLDEDVWIKHLLWNVECCKTYFNKDIDVVVTDGRQINEAKKLQEEGFIVIKVEAPEELRIKRMIESGDCFKSELLYHETELQVDNIEADYTIQNTGTLEDLKLEVKAIVKDIKLMEEC